MDDGPHNAMLAGAEGAPRVALRGIAKSYPGVQALRGVDLVIEAGEIHALCGENGAGKSTLLGVLGGVVRPDAGTLELDGQPVRFRSPADALAAGVAVIHQEFSLVGSLTVAENLLLGAEPHRGLRLDRATLNRQARERLERLGFAIDPAARADRLPTGQRQLVEIARALGRDARVLVLDEPTAALTAAEAERLFALLAELKRQGLAIVYVSHHLDEVERLADRITVLRDGLRVGTWPAADLPPDRLVAAMVGTVVERRGARRSAPTGPPLLEVEDLAGRTLRGVRLAVPAGTIVGLTGLAGAGQEELARILTGADPPTQGSIRWRGAPYRPGHPADAIQAGVGSVPADRRREGLIPGRDLTANIALAALRSPRTTPALARWGLLVPGRRRALARRAIAEQAIACSGPDQAAITLSGGNQQKLLLARCAATAPELLVLSDPTRGIDVRTREAIHRWIEDQAAAGLGVVLVTSDTHELLRLADVVHVLRDGRIARTLTADAADEQSVLAAMTRDGP